MPQQITLFDSYLKENVTLTGDTTVKKDTIKLYSCGPTVYNYQTIGNMRAAWLPDTIAKVAKLAGWQVEWTLNITDVGHLVSDGDEGEDKIEKGAKRDGKTVDQIVSYYTHDYLMQCQALNFDMPEGKFNPKATDYIQEQMILTLELLNKGLAYLTDDGIYYDTLAVTTSKQLNLSSTAQSFLKKSQSIKKTSQFTDRAILETDKKHPDDFAVWKFVSEKNLQKWRFEDCPKAMWIYDKIKAKLTQSAPNFTSIIKDKKILLNHGQLDFLKQAISQHKMISLWGTPGWHSECVCMICGTLNGHFPPKLPPILPLSRGQGGSYSNTVIDIHTGGEDHIDIHHRNEILQSEALGFKLSQYWIHNKFVMVNGGKMSKSLGNVYLVTGKHQDTGFYSLTNPPQEIADRLEAKYQVSSFDPLAYRLMLMEHHYTEQMNFTWEKLEQSQVRLWNLRKEAAKLDSLKYGGGESALKEPYTIFNQTEYDQKRSDFVQLLTDNLNLPKALETYQFWLDEAVKSTLEQKVLNETLYNLLVEFDDLVWKLDLLHETRNSRDHNNIYALGQSRFEAKKTKNWAGADKIRDKISALGWQIDDYAWGWGVWVKDSSIRNLDK